MDPFPNVIQSKKENKMLSCMFAKTIRNAEMVCFYTHSIFVFNFLNYFNFLIHIFIFIYL